MGNNIKKAIIIFFICTFSLLSYSTMGEVIIEENKQNITSMKDELGLIKQFSVYFLFGRVNSLNIAHNDTDFSLELESIRLTCQELHRYGFRQFSFQILRVKADL